MWRLEAVQNSKFLLRLLLKTISNLKYVTISPNWGQQLQATLRQRNVARGPKKRKMPWKSPELFCIVANYFFPWDSVRKMMPYHGKLWSQDTIRKCFQNNIFCSCCQNHCSKKIYNWVEEERYGSLSFLTSTREKRERRDMKQMRRNFWQEKLCLPLGLSNIWPYVEMVLLCRKLTVASQEREGTSHTDKHK